MISFRQAKCSLLSFSNIYSASSLFKPRIIHNGICFLYAPLSLSFINSFIFFFFYEKQNPEMLQASVLQYPVANSEIYADRLFCEQCSTYLL